MHTGSVAWAARLTIQGNTAKIRLTCSMRFVSLPTGQASQAHRAPETIEWHLPNTNALDVKRKGPDLTLQ